MGRGTSTDMRFKLHGVVKALTAILQYKILRTVLRSSTIDELKRIKIILERDLNESSLREAGIITDGSNAVAG